MCAMNRRGGVDEELKTSRRGSWVLIALVGAAALARLLLWLEPLGFLTGDDVEVLSSGFSVATGLDYRPWEIRNLLVPRLLVAPPVWGGKLLGIVDPVCLVRLGELPFLLLSLLNVVLVFRLAQRVAEPKAGRLMPLLAAAIYAFHWLPMAYGATAYPRTASATCVLLATLLLLGTGRDFVRGGAAGGLVAVAFAVRYSEVIVLLPLALLGVASGFDYRTTFRRGLGLAAGFMSGALVTVGLVDWWTWGTPFASLAEFARYTLVERRASSLVAEQSWYWYAKRAGFWLVPPLLPLLVYRPRRRQLGLWLLFLLPIVVLSMIHHKEMRYLQAVIPFLAVLAAIGAARWIRRGRRFQVAAVVLLLLALGVSVHSALRLHEHGSQAAVAAAGLLAQEGCAERVVVIQAWAYGHRLILGNHVAVIDFDQPPSPEQLRAALPGADAAGLYADDLEARPDLVAVLADSGFRKDREVTVGKSRSVVLFRNLAGRCSEVGIPAA